MKYDVICQLTSKKGFMKNNDIYNIMNLTENLTFLQINIFFISKII